MRCWLSLGVLLATSCAPPRIGSQRAALGSAQVLFLGFDGAAVTSGASDDATQSISSLGAAAAYPAFDASVGAPLVTRAQAEAAVLDRVRGYYLPFDLDVVAARPPSGDFASVLVGGTAASLTPTQQEATAGIAALDCADANPRSLGFAFSDSFSPEFGGLVALAAAIAHEAGHGYGLEHVTNPGDPMYSVAQPTQMLADLFALSFGSGSYSPFVAGGGTQVERCGRADPLDDHAILLAALGARAAATSAPPTVAIAFPPDEPTLPRLLPIEVTAGDDVGVERVEVYRDLELVAVLEQAPYKTVLMLDPAASVVLTVEAIDVDAQRARQQRTFAAATSAPAACDEATPCASPRTCVDRFCRAPVGAACGLALDCEGTCVASQAGNGGAGFCAALCDPAGHCSDGYACTSGTCLAAASVDGGACDAATCPVPSSGCAVAGGPAPCSLLACLLALLATTLRRREILS